MLGLAGNNQPQQNQPTAMEKKKRNVTKWTAAEDAKLAELFPILNTTAVAEILGRTFSSTCGRAKILGIKKTHEKLYSTRFKKGERPSSATEFKPGQMAWNKGKSIPLHPNTAKTTFKPGNLPHNTRHDGAMALRRDGWYIRVEKSKWMDLKHYIWQQHHLPKIPPGWVLRWKDGNRDHHHIDNIEMIPRKENMVLNAIHNYPPEVIELIRTMATYKKKLNKILNNGS